MLKTIPVINNKGGVGKTTTAVNVAAGLARRGRRVLLVDLDSQGSASVSLGVGQDNLAPSSADVLFGEVPTEEAIRSTELDRVDLITGALELANADVRLKQISRGQYRLREVLSTVEADYQTIILDCAPSTSILSVCALVAADAFIVPVAPSYLALEGVVSLGETVRRVRRGIGEAAPILGVLLTMVDRTREDVPDAIRQVRDHYGGKVFDTEIREDPKLEEAPSRGQDIFRYAPESQGADDYDDVIDEIERRLQRYGSVYGDLVNGATDTLHGRHPLSLWPTFRSFSPKQWRSTGPLAWPWSSSIPECVWGRKGEGRWTWSWPGRVPPRSSRQRTGSWSSLSSTGPPRRPSSQWGISIT